MTAMRVEDISFFYEATGDPVIEHLSLGIPEGCVTAVLGPNGAGKTTLLSILLGLLVPCSGEIFVFDKPRARYPEKRIKQMLGMVSQNEAVRFDLNVTEYVLLGRAPYLPLLRLPGQHDMEVAMEAMKTAGIDLMRNRAVPSLSSGERQLASIARVLSQVPDILLFDEPTSHLDLSNSRKILSLMKTIATKEHRTVVFTTHDPNAAVAIADHVVLLGRKGIVACGPVQDAFTEKNLSAAYDEPIEVLQTRRGPVILAI